MTNYNHPDGSDFSSVTKPESKYQYTDSADKPPSKRINSGLLVLIVIVAVAVITVVFTTIFSGNSIVNLSTLQGNPLVNFALGSQKTTVPKQNSPLSKDYVAVLRIEGVIEKKNKTYDQRWLVSTVKALEDDKKNKGILLLIDSPGGGVYESDELYHAVITYKSKTARPVWAYITSLGASGGYYIACASDVIIANRNALVGSIGVISGASLDISELMQKYGIKMTTFTAGKNKGMLGLNTPLTEEQRQIMQSIADEAYNQFTGIVAESRKIPLQTVKNLADGRIYTAAQAKAGGLLDEILFYDDATEKMKSDASLKSDVEMREFSNRISSPFYDFILGPDSIFKTKVAGNLPSIIINQLENQPPYPAYYFSGALR